MQEWTIDHQSFALFVFAQRETKRKISMREAAEDAGLSAAVFARAENKQTVSASNFLALCFWMGANPYWFLVDPKTGNKVANPPGAEPDPPRELSPGPGAGVRADQRRMNG